MTLPAGEKSSGDLLIIGAGLAAAVIAQRLCALATPPRITILEASPTPFGNHTWSFHAADLGPDDMGWLRPLVAHEWPGQDVHFPAYRRRLTSPYASLTSERVAEALARHPNVTIEANVPVGTVDARGVTLADGRRIDAGCVIDARGFAPDEALVIGYQKFVGLEVEFSELHGVDVPMIMDATVDQLDGYRFVYLLPFGPKRLLIEDTRYADGGALDDASLEAAIEAYIAEKQWKIASRIRTERGILPISLAFDPARFWASKPTDIPQAGMRAGLFHPTTGYSLPEAVRLANLVAAHWPTVSATLASAIRHHALERARQQRFYRFLNRMLFKAARPDRRHLVLQRFYRLPQPLVERFYAGTTTFADICRILIGKPPVPVHRALPCMFEFPLLRKKDTA